MISYNKRSYDTTRGIRGTGNYILRRRFIMNPVIGLDVAKGESQVQAYLERKKPYKKSFKVKHDLDGLASLLEFINKIEDISGERPPLVMESTGHYHTPVVQYFEEKGYLIIT
jgi:transposase